MMSTAAASRPDAFRHEALLYDGADEFVARVAAFIDDAVAADEPILVVASAEKIARLQPPSEHRHLVELADMDEVGRNPARIIPAWAEFLARHRGSAVRGVGEPVTADRDDVELVEYQHHESLLNVAFADTGSFWLVCPYDTSTLRDDVLAEAARSHPFVADGHTGPLAARATNDSGEGDDNHAGLHAAVVLDEPLPEPGAAFAEHGLRPGRLSDLRAFVADRGGAAGLAGERLDDLVVAANEIGSNSLLYGSGEARVRLWREAISRDTVICEIAGGGLVTDPMVGRLPPGHEEHDSRGLWMAYQLCDLVQVRSSACGTVVRLHMRLV